MWNSNTRALYVKELREIVRDRRALVMTVVFPIVFYPLLISTLFRATDARTSRWRAATAVVGLVGAERSPGILQALSGRMAIRFDRSVREPGAAAAVVLALPADFDEQVSAGDGPPTVTLSYDRANERSAVVRAAVERALEAVRRETVVDRARQAGLAPRTVEPFTIVAADRTLPGRLGALLFARVLSLLVVVIALTASFFAALDIGAGERERQTLQTLLVSPAARREIAAAKLAAVFTVTMASAVVNIASMAIVLSPKVLALRGMGAIDFSVPGLAAGVILLALTPLALFFSAVTLTVSTLARTYKEASSYFLPLSAVMMPLAFVVMLPDVEPTVYNLLLPVTNVTLLLRQALSGAATAGLTAIVLLSTVLYSLAAAAVTVRLYNGEGMVTGTWWRAAYRIRVGRAAVEPAAGREGHI